MLPPYARAPRKRFLGRFLTVGRSLASGDTVPEHHDVLSELYRQMLRIRRFEEAAAKAYSQGKIGGFLHLYIGQEASAVGALSVLTPKDYVVGTYRDHGLALAR